LIAEDDTCLGCEVDHIISEKHGGLTIEDNLALACAFCNQAKGSDVGSIVWQTRAFVRFFNPRIDRWNEHFRLLNYRIEPLTEIGIVTAQILRFNSVERLLERQALVLVKRYPSEPALKRILSGGN
jgi:hypothetical protein